MHANTLFPPPITAIVGATSTVFFNGIIPCWVGDICRSHEIGEEEWGAEGGLIVACCLNIYFPSTNMSVAASYMAIVHTAFQDINTAMRRHAFRSRNHTVVQNQRPYQIEFAASEYLKHAFLTFAAPFITYIWSFVDIVGCKRLHTSALQLGRYYIVRRATFPLHGFWIIFAYTHPIVAANSRREISQLVAVAIS